MTTFLDRVFSPHFRRLQSARNILPIALIGWGLLGAGCSDSKTSGEMACSRDSECGLGTVCQTDRCVDGCNSTRDCPTTAPLCDVNSGDQGACVVCIDDTQCKRGETCQAGGCVASCKSDRDCTGQYCDSATQRCVECLSSSQCPLNRVCSGDNKCVSGCFGDRDCQSAAPFCRNPTSDVPGGCVECIETRDCGRGKACTNNICVASCNSGQDCPGQVCDVGTHACVDCVNTSSCALGSVCANNSCVAGCESARDCTPASPICEPNDGDHGVCYQCSASRDCATGETCNNHLCEAPTPAGEGEFCLDSAGCGNGLSCYTVEHRCLITCIVFRNDCPRVNDVCRSTGEEPAGFVGVCVPG
jgi:hypothetical protein